MTFYLTFVLFSTDNGEGSKRKTAQNRHFWSISVHQWTDFNGFKSRMLHQKEPLNRKGSGGFLIFLYLTFYLTFSKNRKTPRRCGARGSFLFHWRLYG